MVKKTKLFLIVIVLLMLGGVYSGTIVVVCSRSDPAIAFHSDMSSVSASISVALRIYYEREGRYPDRLEVLKEVIVSGVYAEAAPEEPKEVELLSRFDYSTDGETYTLAWSVRWRRGSVSAYKEYGRHGRLVGLETYRDGKIASRRIEMDRGN